MIVGTILYNWVNRDVRLSIQAGNNPVTFVDDITIVDGSLVLVTLSSLDEATRLEGHVKIAVDKGGDVHVVPVLDLDPTRLVSIQRPAKCRAGSELYVNLLM